MGSREAYQTFSLGERELNIRQIRRLTKRFGMSSDVFIAHGTGRERNKLHERYCSVEDDVETLLQTATKDLGLAARAYSRAPTVVRITTDLACTEEIHSAYITAAAT